MISRADTESTCWKVRSSPVPNRQRQWQYSVALFVPTPTTQPRAFVDRLNLGGTIAGVASSSVSKTYPAQKGVRYSKIRPITGWWRMLRPFILLGLRIKKYRELNHGHG